MRVRKTILSFVLFIASFFLWSVPVFADNSYTMTEGETTEIEYDGEDGSREGGERNTQTETGGGGGGGSGGGTYTPPPHSDEYNQLRGSRSSVVESFITDPVNEARDSSMFDNAIVNNNDIIRLAEVEIGKDKFGDLDKFIEDFEKLFGGLPDWEKNTADFCNILKDRKLDDVLSKMGLTEEEKYEVPRLFYSALMGDEEYPGSGGGYDFNQYIGSLDMSRLWFPSGFGGGGFEFGDMDIDFMMPDNLPTFEEMKKKLEEMQKDPTITLTDPLIELIERISKMTEGGLPIDYKSGDIRNLREDLFTGGLNGYSSFYDSMKNFRNIHKEIFDRNAGQETLMVLYLEDNHIVEMDSTEYYNVSFTSDKRLWSVYDQSGKLVKQVETENRDHKFLFRGFPQGTYTVIAQQWADYQITKSFYYRKYEYLIDTATRTMLWARRSESNKIMLKDLWQSGYRPNGETFIIHVNKYGEVENETRYSERVE